MRKHLLLFGTVEVTLSGDPSDPRVFVCRPLFVYCHQLEREYRSRPTAERDDLTVTQYCSLYAGARTVAGDTFPTSFRFDGQLFFVDRVPTETGEAVLLVTTAACIPSKIMRTDGRFRFEGGVQ